MVNVCVGTGSLFILSSAIVQLYDRVVGGAPPVVFVQVDVMPAATGGITFIAMVFPPAPLLVNGKSLWLSYSPIVPLTVPFGYATLVNVTSAQVSR